MIKTEAALTSFHLGFYSGPVFLCDREPSNLGLYGFVFLLAMCGGDLGNVVQLADFAMPTCLTKMINSEPAQHLHVSMFY